MRVRLFAVAAVVLFGVASFVACSGQVDPVVPPGDGGGRIDAGVDLSGDGPVSMIDMARPWADVSVMTNNNFWTVANTGTGTFLAAGDGAMFYKSTGGGAFMLEPSMKPVDKPNILSIGTNLPGPPTKPMYTVGQQGAVWSYTGDLTAGTGMFAAETSGATKGLYGVWVAPDGTTWVVGDGAAYKRSGGTWTALTGIDSTASAYNLWGSTTNTGYTLYAVGSSGKIWHSDGGNFVAETSGTNSALYGVWGSGPTDIYAVGDVGTILHSTGNGTWTQQNSGVSVPLEGISGVDANQIYVVGDTATLLHKNDAASMVWDPEKLPDSAQGRACNAVSATASVVYVVGNAGLIMRK
jgi:hypothetical protein